MQIDWLFGLTGGVLIGLAGAVYLLINGRIMGASGIIGGLIDGSAGSQAKERIFFLMGLFGVPLVMALVFGDLRTDGPAQTYITPNILAVIVAGLLVGVGTRMANGCTSGHGVCGISRLSLRGIAATVFYIMAGGFGVVIFKHLLGWV